MQLSLTGLSRLLISIQVDQIIFIFIYQIDINRAIFFKGRLYTNRYFLRIKINYKLSLYHIILTSSFELEKRSTVGSRGPLIATSHTVKEE
jgi:hypothetical protein